MSDESLNRRPRVVAPLHGGKKTAHNTPGQTWGVPGALFLGVATYLLPTVLVGVFVPFIEALTVTDNIRNFVYTAIFECLTLATLAMFVRGYGLKFGQALGLATFHSHYIGAALLGLGAYFVLTIGLNAFLTDIIVVEDVPQELGFAAPVGIEYILIFIALVVLAPITEELLFRGFVFKGLRTKWPFWLSAVVVSLLFAIAHGQLNVGIDVFSLSLVLCYLREHTGSLWPSIVVHMLKNAIAYSALFVFKIAG